MKNFFNQFECREVKAGEVIYDTEQLDNILLFVIKGKLLICSKTSTPAIEINEGHFVLLPAEKRYIITTMTDVQTVLMHAGELSAMITEDPEWNPEQLIILPIFPALENTLQQLKTFNQE